MAVLCENSRQVFTTKIDYAKLRIDYTEMYCGI